MDALLRPIAIDAHPVARKRFRIPDAGHRRLLRTAAARSLTRGPLVFGAITPGR